MQTLAFISSIGPLQWLIIGIVALLLFGKRLPDVARSLGRSFGEFKRGLAEKPEENDKQESNTSTEINKDSTDDAK